MSARFVFWDFDGTLSYFELGYFSDTLIRVMDAYSPGHGIDREDAAGPMRPEYFWHSPHIAHTELNGKPELWWERVCGIFERQLVRVGVHPNDAPRLAHETRALYCDPARHLLYEDSLPAVRLLHERGFRQGILSNHVPELGAIVAGQSELARYMEIIVNSADIGYEKPRREIYDAALEMAGVSAREAVMVGDNIVADIEGAQAAGMAAVLVRKPGDGRAAHCFPDALKAARFIAESFGDA